MSTDSAVAPAPDTADPGAADPATGDPGATESAASDPGAADPATGDPGATESAASDPGAADPATGDPGTSGRAAAGTPTTEPGAPAARPLDFSQPTKFTPELRRRIDRVVTAFCKATALRLTSELSAPVELSRVNASQLAWSAARSSLPPDPLLAALDVQPIAKQMLLAVEQPLVTRALCCMLGGSAANAPVEHKLSDIDWALARRLLDVITGQLSLVWRDLGDLELAVKELETEGDAGVLLPSGEPTLAVRLQCAIADIPSALVLLLPWSAIEPAAGQILDRGGPADGADPEQARALERGLARTSLLVRAEIGTAVVPVNTVLSLAPGSVLTLDAKAERGVRLLAHRVELAHGLPGRSGTRKAVKLTSPVQPRSDHTARPLPGTSAHAASAPPTDAGAALERINHLRGVELHVWAELGHAEIPIGTALTLPQGAVLELDQGADEPVAVFVNGVHFGSGALVVADDDRWAVELGALA